MTGVDTPTHCMKSSGSATDNYINIYVKLYFRLWRTNSKEIP